MVVPLVGAASAAASTASTALGLGMGKTDLDLTRDLFKLQMRQAKRLWTADWAEQSIRHGEQCMQSAQQHAEAQAMAAAAYYQAEKLASQGIKLARDQDSRAYEMAWRAEVRESLRDDLTNQNNRFNIIMLCDTVCLGCCFTLVADGAPPMETSATMIGLYVFSLGFSVMVFSVSLWCSVLVVRRLHEHTAATLERKLFAQSEELQKIWQYQLNKNIPTGPREMYLVNQGYEKWLADYLEPLGRTSIHLLSVGIVAMFITAGLLVHNQYIGDYNVPSAVIIFWSTVAITSATVISMKGLEDRSEKQKEGVYDMSWLDNESPIEAGPFAKVTKMADELSSNMAVGLGSVARMESLSSRERQELEFCAKTEFLHRQLETLRKESEQRANTRKDVLQLLTTAAEELDALPEDLTSKFNKMLHDIDEADTRTASSLDAVMQSANAALDREASAADWSRLSRLPLSPTSGGSREPMPRHPLDAQRIPVSLGVLRKKLGEVPLTTMLRLRNLSDEPVRLKSGVQLKEGKYIKSLHATDPQHNAAVYYLYPGSEIPPRTEAVIVARSGGAWIPTSGIAGELVYSNRQETWTFKIKFRNELVRGIRKYRVDAYPNIDQPHGIGRDNDADGVENVELDQYWQISKNEVGRKANAEVIITLDLLRGEDASAAALSHKQSLINLKSGYLFHNTALGLQWQQKWFVLTPTEVIVAPDPASRKKHKISLRDITSVAMGSDLVKRNVFVIQSIPEGPFKLSAATPEDRDDWIRKILNATGMGILEATMSRMESTSSVSTFKDGIECVQSERGTEVLPKGSSRNIGLRFEDTIKELETSSDPGP